MSTNGLLTLGEVRAAAAAALAPPPDSGWSVHGDYLDAVDPPALVLIWAEPWLTPNPRTIGTCQWTAHLIVWALAGRLDPDAAVATLEELVAFTHERLAADAHKWPAGLTQAPRVWRVGDVPLLGARVSYDVPVLLEGGP